MTGRQRPLLQGSGVLPMKLSCMGDRPAEKTQG